MPESFPPKPSQIGEAYKGSLSTPRPFKAFDMDLSIIIVNWNSTEYLRACLQSLYKETKDVVFEVIVVDNASYDGCAEMLKCAFPEVKFIQNTENQGFSAANNVGFLQALGQFVLFLNPDTVILEDAINTMLGQMRHLKDAGAIGCRLLNTDGSLQTSSVMPFPTILNQAFNFEALRLLFPRIAFWGIRPLFEDVGSEFVVQAVSGACILVRRDVFEKIGMFSTDYFMYSEDIDLCHRISLAGYKVYYVRTAAIIHHGGGSSRQRGVNLFSEVKMKDSTMIYLRKYKGGSYAVFYNIVIGLTALLRIMALTLISLCAPRTSVLNSLTKWKVIFRWSLGRTA
jgi:GT2 family glycosyltransferase